MDSVNLNVVDFGTANAVAAEDGMRLHAAIRDALRSGRSVLLDFTGVDALTSAFLNAAVGQLLAEYTSPELLERLKVQSDDQDKLRLIRRVVERARDYFEDFGRHSYLHEDVLDGTR